MDWKEWTSPLAEITVVVNFMLCSSCFSVFTVKKLSHIFSKSPAIHLYSKNYSTKTHRRRAVINCWWGGAVFCEGDGKKLVVSFGTEDDSIRNVNTRVFVVGDLKFYAHVLGRENMSSFWCMWCDAHPNTWQNLDASWTVDNWWYKRTQK